MQSEQLRWRCILLMAVLLLTSIEAGARTDSLRCGNHLVRVGDSSDSVLMHCGKPDAIRHINKFLGEPEAIGDTCYSGQVVLEQWIYKRQINAPAVLTVDGGKLRQIQLGRVSNVQRPDCR